MKVFLFSMKKMHFCFAENYCLASRCKLYFPWCHCPSEHGLLLLFPSTKSVIAWKRAYETLSHETFVLKIACEILTDEFSSGFPNYILRKEISVLKIRKKIRLLSLLSIYASAFSRIIAPLKRTRCGRVPPSFRHYHESLTTTLVIFRPPLLLDRFYLDDNYSLFEVT